MSNQELYVQIFKGTQAVSVLQDQINLWLSTNQGTVVVVDIKYGYGLGFGGAGYSAMIIYRVKR